MIKKIILIYNVVVITVLIVLGFVTARSITHIIAAVLFFPLTAYFWLLIIPTRNRAIPMVIKPMPMQKKPRKKEPVLKLTPMKDRPKGVFDVDRRMFLRLIGSAGVSVFILSIFTKKAEAAFFGSVPGPGTVGVKDSAGNLIDPAEKTPTDGYSISQIDDSTPAYYGYVNKGGAWYIVKEDSSGAYRYTKGASSFSTNWTNRASLTYDYFDSIF